MLLIRCLKFPGHYILDEIDVKNNIPVTSSSLLHSIDHTNWVYDNDKDVLLIP